MQTQTRVLKRMQTQQAKANITMEMKEANFFSIFWIFDKEQHRRLDIDTKGQCCFWHVIGLP